MRGSEILEKINRRETENFHFIKWWRKEEDFLDFDLIDRFRANTKGDEEIGGFDLLNMEQMWEQVATVAGDRVRKEGRNGEQVVVWEHKGKVNTCPYVPETLITIFDVETRDSYVD